MRFVLASSGIVLGLLLCWRLELLGAAGPVNLRPEPTHARGPALAAFSQAAASPAAAPRVPAAPDASGGQRSAVAPAVSAHGLTAEERGVLTKYCVTCHNQRLKTAGLALDAVLSEGGAAGSAIPVGALGAQAVVWEKVIRKLRSGAMPPVGSPRPDAATYDSLALSLEASLDRAAAAGINPGRTDALHRLTRTEYRNAVRDLLDLEVDVTALLPADNADRNGFDNMTSVLSVSPVLLDRYVSAAHKISRLAVGTAPAGPAVESYTVPITVLQDDRMDEGAPLGSRGGRTIRHLFPVDGEYEISIRLQTNYIGYLRGVLSSHDLELRLDGARVKTFTVGGEAPGRPTPASYEGNIFGSVEWEAYMHDADKHLRLRLPVTAGPHTVGVAFMREAWAAEGVLQPRPFGFALAVDAMPDSSPGLGKIEIAGPFNVTGPGDSPSRRRIFACRPTRPADESACADQILSRLARLAYRRPIGDTDRRAIRTFYERGRQGGDFDAGIQTGLERILSAPDFLFRIERDPRQSAVNAARTTAAATVASPATSGAYRLTGLELASRLSFFLWSSIPDEPLLDVAISGKLQDPRVLQQQVRRMLADRRASALVENFFGQWLMFREVHNRTPDPVTYPEFDDSLREALQRETSLFIESQLREDRGIMDLVTADYTFLNARLAEHYRIPGVYGSRFRKVTLPDGTQRGGLLGHGSVLLVTSYPNRTSPVLRGKWLLDNMLGAPPPPPPPDVPALPERGEGGKPASVRELLETHRKNVVCANCHAQMDPLGFSLEAFDGIGGWRTTGEGGAPIDASASLVNGTKFEGLDGLRSVLVNRREQFVRTVSEKLLAYALGREANAYDMPTIRSVVRASAAGGYKWSSVIIGLVESPPFQMRALPQAAPASTVASAQGSALTTDVQTAKR